MHTRTIIAVLAFAVVWSQFGCSRADPRHTPISSATVGAYDRWRMASSGAIKSEEWREFDAMLQELRLRIMAKREAAGHDAIEASLRSKIHGSTFRDVIIIGHQAKLARLTEEREQVRRVMNGNAHKTGILGNTGPFAEFERARAAQEKRLLAIDDEIRGTKRRLTDFGHY